MRSPHLHGTTKNQLSVIDLEVGTETEEATDPDGPTGHLCSDMDVMARWAVSTEHPGPLTLRHDVLSVPETSQHPMQRVCESARDRQVRKRCTKKRSPFPRNPDQVTVLGRSHCMYHDGKAGGNETDRCSCKEAQRQARESNAGNLSEG